MTADPILHSVGAAPSSRLCVLTIVRHRVSSGLAHEDCEVGAFTVLLYEGATCPAVKQLIDGRLVLCATCGHT